MSKEKDESKDTEKSKGGKKDSQPSDLQFHNSKKNITSYVLKLKEGEELEAGIARLQKNGWEIEGRAYTREGRAIRAVGKRIKTSVRNLKKGDVCKVEYYDIQEAANEDALDPGKIWEKTLIYQATKGQALVFMTEGGSYFAFPISVVANVLKLDQKSESDAGKPGQPDSANREESSDPVPPNDPGDDS